VYVEVGKAEEAAPVRTHLLYYQYFTTMAKEEKFEKKGEVVSALRDDWFKVKISNLEEPVMGYIAGKIRQNDIKIVPGDTVVIEFSNKDVTKGRITQRLGEDVSYEDEEEEDEG
jgi:translation initiation factor IF-1